MLSSWHEVPRTGIIDEGAPLKPIKSAKVFPPPSLNFTSGQLREREFDILSSWSRTGTFYDLRRHLKNSRNLPYTSHSHSLPPSTLPFLFLIWDYYYYYFFLYLDVLTSA